MTDDPRARIRCAEVWGGNHAVEIPLLLPGLEGWIISRPHLGGQAGGDVHLVSSCGTGRITRLLLADVSGHGEHVAELGRRLRGHMQRYLNHIEPRQLAERLNRDMRELAEGSGRFATALISTYFAPTGEFTICNAGHPPPMLYRHASQKWKLIQQPDELHAIQNLPLGILEDAGYRGRRLTLNVGDVIVFYTDCLNEARHAEHGMLGVEGLMEAVAEISPEALAAPPPVMLDGLLAGLDDRCFGCDDDLTMVVLRCTERSLGRGLGPTAAGVWRSLRTLWSRQPIPWPEFSWANLGGAVLRKKWSSR